MVGELLQAANMLTNAIAVNNSNVGNRKEFIKVWGKLQGMCVQVRRAYVFLQPSELAREGTKIIQTLKVKSC